MARWDKFKARFDLYTGVIGLIADTITILGVIGAELILPSISYTRIVGAALDSLILLTAFVGLYSLTMIVWFLFRRQRAEQTTKTFGFDELCDEPESSPVFNVMMSLIPVLGAFFSMLSLHSVRVIFWLAVFISLLPTALWLYLLSAQVWVSCIGGLLGSFILSQYASFFALVLDKFFESRQL
jgi:hypothetical protein